MKKRLTIAVSASLLVALLAGGNRIAVAYADQWLSRYPGAVAVAAEEIDFGRTQPGAVTRQGEYATTDSLAAVQHWYATRLQLEPASDNYVIGPCVWLTNSQLVYRVVHAVSVLLCKRPEGTSVVVNETIHLWP